VHRHRRRYHSHAPSPDPSPLAPATAVLDDAQKQAGFAIALLRLAEDAAADLTTRQSAALLFKNIVKRSWKVRARRGTVDCVRSRASVRQLPHQRLRASFFAQTPARQRLRANIQPPPSIHPPTSAR
jgi:hypothetical protein